MTSSGRSRSSTTRTGRRRSSTMATAARPATARATTADRNVQVRQVSRIASTTIIPSNRASRIGRSMWIDLRTTRRLPRPSWPRCTPIRTRTKATRAIRASSS
uniref:(northern house mosquito) hypothetical protein n=1 Tax=Culex pipiens TaxID=7175 RepID=A0A8D8D6T1_CULPI